MSMSFTIVSALMLSAQPPSQPSTSLPKMLPGIYTNEEQVYFETDEGRPAPQWMSIEIKQNGDILSLKRIDAYGQPQGKVEPITITEGEQRDILKVSDCARFFEREADGWTYSAVQNRKRCRQPYQIGKITPDGITIKLKGGAETILKRARPVECWAAIPKTVSKEDGSPDWLFAQKLELHDQGGRVKVGGKDSGAEEIILRMRAVHWPPPSTNRPSMVLYVHKPDKPDSAVSYSWADINASRVGLNLRWMQASCTISEAERGSDVTAQNFRG